MSRENFATLVDLLREYLRKEEGMEEDHHNIQFSRGKSRFKNSDVRWGAYSTSDANLRSIQCNNRNNLPRRTDIPNNSSALPFNYNRY